MPEDKDAFLKGKNLYLRPLYESDIDGDYPSWLNDEEVCYGNSHHVYPNDKMKTMDFIKSSSKSSSSIVLAIIERKEEKHIGNVSLQKIHWIYRAAEFAILIGDKKYWGQGLAFEAAKLIISHGFNNLNLNRISCGTFENNSGMIKLAQKLGMTEIGRERKSVYKNGRYLDMVLFDCLSSEYNA